MVFTMNHAEYIEYDKINAAENYSPVMGLFYCELLCGYGFNFGSQSFGNNLFSALRYSVI